MAVKNLGELLCTTVKICAKLVVQTGIEYRTINKLLTQNLQHVNTPFR